MLPGMGMRDAARMIGGIMPKSFAVRWPVGLAPSLLLIAAVIAVLPAVGAFSAAIRLGVILGLVERDDFAGERDELRFFGAALDRIDAELGQKGDAAQPSLRKAREAVVQRIREIAIRVPRDRLPADALRLVSAAPGRLPAASQAEAPAAASRPPVLLTGLEAPRPASNPGLPLLDANLPLPLFVDRAPPAARTRSPAAPEEPASADQAKAERARAQRARAERAQRARTERAEHAEPERPRAGRAEAKSTVADQSERRQALQ